MPSFVIELTPSLMDAFNAQSSAKASPACAELRHILKTHKLDLEFVLHVPRHNELGGYFNLVAANSAPFDLANMRAALKKIGRLSGVEAAYEKPDIAPF